MARKPNASNSRDIKGSLSQGDTGEIETRFQLARRALVWLLVLGPLFFISYGFTNWVASLHAEVPSIAFDWERAIPFIAWTILPYCSTDILYAVSLFLCNTRRELNVHAMRLLTAQILSVYGFLLFPLRTSFVRPEQSGFFGWLFHQLTRLDQPFNEAPSLHLSLTVILWARSSAHLSGVWLLLVRAWLVLIGVSTLTTFQHHFIDLPTGIGVGSLALVLFPMRQHSADAQRRRLCATYFTGSLLIGAFALRFSGPALLLLWPATALLIVSIIYWTGNPAWFGKREGRMHPVMRLMLAPYVAGARLNARLWTRRDAVQEIAPGVWIGRLPQSSEWSSLGMASMVDLTAELPIRDMPEHYRGIPMLDLMVPTVEQLNQAVRAIEELAKSRPTLVCCALGYSRSAAAITAWLVASKTCGSMDEAIERLTKVRPQVRLSQVHRERLKEWMVV